MVGFGIVKTFPTDHELAYERTGHFEPKAGLPHHRPPLPVGPATPHTCCCEAMEPLRATRRMDRR